MYQLDVEDKARLKVSDVLEDTLGDVTQKVVYGSWAYWWLRRF